MFLLRQFRFCFFILASFQIITIPTQTLDLKFDSQHLAPTTSIPSLLLTPDSELLFNDRLLLLHFMRGNPTQLESSSSKLYNLFIHLLELVDDENPASFRTRPFSPLVQATLPHSLEDPSFRLFLGSAKLAEYLRLYELKCRAFHLDPRDTLEAQWNSLKTHLNHLEEGLVRTILGDWKDPHWFERFLNQFALPKTEGRFLRIESIQERFTTHPPEILWLYLNVENAEEAFKEFPAELIWEWAQEVESPEWNGSLKDWLTTLRASAFEVRQLSLQVFDPLKIPRPLQPKNFYGFEYRVTANPHFSTVWVIPPISDAIPQPNLLLRITLNALKSYHQIAFWGKVASQMTTSINGTSANLEKALATQRTHDYLVDPRTAAEGLWMRQAMETLLQLRPRVPELDAWDEKEGFGWILFGGDGAFKPTSLPDAVFGKTQFFYDHFQSRVFDLCVGGRKQAEHELLNWFANGKPSGDKINRPFLMASAAFTLSGNPVLRSIAVEAVSSTCHAHFADHTIRTLLEFLEKRRLVTGPEDLSFQLATTFLESFPTTYLGGSYPISFELFEILTNLGHGIRTPTGYCYSNGLELQPLRAASSLDSTPPAEVPPLQPPLALDDALEVLLAEEDVIGTSRRFLENEMLQDPMERRLLGVTPSNVKNQALERFALLRAIVPKILAMQDTVGADVAPLASLGIKLSDLWKGYLPLALHLIRAKQKRNDKTLVVGINASAGTGKSTLVQILKIILQEKFRNQQIVEVSLDDFYFSKGEREARGVKSRLEMESTDSNFARLIWRLKKSGPHSVVKIPRFNKGKDDREREPTVIQGKVGIVLFEGWRLGIDHPIYQPFLQPVEILIHLSLPLEEVKRQKFQQVERDVARAGKKFDPADLEQKWTKYLEPIARDYILPVRDKADVVVLKGKGHRILKIIPRVEESASRPGRPLWGESSLEGQVAIVTGGGKNIGRKITKTLARKGARVIITGRDRAALEETAEALSAEGAQIKVHPSDVTHPEEANRLFHSEDPRFERVHILVNNAGVAGNIATAPDKPLATVAEIPMATDPASPNQHGWLDTMAINFMGSWLNIKEAVSHWSSEKRSGTIVNNSTFYAGQRYFLRSIYTVNKALEQAMTLALYRELKAKGILIMDMAFSLVESERMKMVVPNMRKGALARGANPDDPAFQETVEQLVPTEPPTIEEVAARVVQAIELPEIHAGKVNLVSRWPGHPEFDRKPLEWVEASFLSRNSFDLSGQRVVIAGRFQETSEQLYALIKAFHKAQAEEIILIGPPVPLPAALSQKVHFLPVENLSEEAGVERAFQEIKRRFGAPNTVLYLTGNPRTPLLDYANAQELKSQFLDPYVTAPVLVAREALRAMPNTHNREREGTFLILGPHLTEAHPEKLPREETASFVMQQALQQLVRVMLVEHEIILNSPRFRAYYLLDSEKIPSAALLAQGAATLASRRRLEIPPQEFLIRLHSWKPLEESI